MLNPDFAESVRASFGRQNAMNLIRATLHVVEHGRTEIHVPHWDAIEQQHGFVHGGVVGMIADSAAGYAAMTIVAVTASVLTVEYKMNLVTPADGEKLIARIDCLELIGNTADGYPAGVRLSGLRDCQLSTFRIRPYPPRWGVNE